MGFEKIERNVVFLLEIFRLTCCNHYDSAVCDLLEIRTHDIQRSKMQARKNCHSLLSSTSVTSTFSPFSPFPLRPPPPPPPPPPLR